MKGVGILMKPGFIVTFCSVRKLFLAVPNTVCCSVEHRRADNNLAAITSKNKSHTFFFLFSSLKKCCNITPSSQYKLSNLFRLRGCA